LVFSNIHVQEVAVVDANATGSKPGNAKRKLVHGLQAERSDANVSGFPVQMLAIRPSANSSVVLWTPVAAQHNNRHSGQCAQCFQRLEQLRIQLKTPAAVAHELVPVEMDTKISHGALSKMQFV
jgi:hypothetical protein